MRILPKYAGLSAQSATPCVEEDEAVVGLQASLRSSDSLKGILECARGRCAKRGLDDDRLKKIERISIRYESHQKAVRDHCLDYFGSEPEKRIASDLHDRTTELLVAGRRLYAELREAILTTY